MTLSNGWILLSAPTLSRIVSASAAVNLIFELSRTNWSRADLLRLILAAAAGVLHSLTTGSIERLTASLPGSRRERTRMNVARHRILVENFEESSDCPFVLRLAGTLRDTTCSLHLCCVGIDYSGAAHPAETVSFGMDQSR